MIWARILSWQKDLSSPKRPDEDLGSNHPSPPPYLVISGSSVLKVKRLGFVANHSSPSSADVKNIGAIRKSSHLIRSNGVYQESYVI
jgi:hypothetical protein